MQMWSKWKDFYHVWKAAIFRLSSTVRHYKFYCMLLPHRFMLKRGKSLGEGGKCPEGVIVVWKLINL